MGDWPTAAVALVAAAGFRAAPGVLIVPLETEFGWSRSTLSAAVSVNLVLFGLTAPFAAALMDRFGIRRVTAAALAVVAIGSGGTVWMTSAWQLVLCWGILIGLGTGSMALVFAATVAQRWFMARRGLVMGILTAGSATGQLVFLAAHRLARRWCRMAGGLTYDRSRGPRCCATRLAGVAGAPL